jgi:tetratricopeptide (TPR) repeat protein
VEPTSEHAPCRLRLDESVKENIFLPCTSRDCAMTASSSYYDCHDIFTENASNGHESQKCGKYAQAVTYYRCALLCMKSSIDSETIEVQVQYANILFNVGIIYMDHLKDLSFSADAFQQCLDLRIECLGTTHIDVSATMYCLARAHMMLESDREYALELLIEALSILLMTCPHNMNGIITVWNELARVQYALGEIEDAESSMREIRKLSAQVSPFVW